MSVAKVIEVVSESTQSFDDAIKQGLTAASKTLHGITGLDVVHWTAKVENNQIVRYKVTMHIAFAVDQKG